MILVAVGTFVHGFDALVVAADIAACQLGLPGFAQIGIHLSPRTCGRILPTHRNL